MMSGELQISQKEKLSIKKKWIIGAETLLFMSLIGGGKPGRMCRLSLQ